MVCSALEAALKKIGEQFDKCSIPRIILPSFAGEKGI